jgi:hypothetical protein
MMTYFLNKFRINHYLVGLLIILLALTILFFLIFNFWSVGIDYYYTYHVTTEKWLQGETKLYDNNNQGFYNLPWLLVLFIPLHFLPLAISNTILILLSLLAILTAIIILMGFKQSTIFIILALLNPIIFDLLFIRSQIDAFILLGVALGWLAIKQQRPWLFSLSILLLTLKPINILLIIILFIYAIRHWPIFLWIKTIILPLSFTLLFCLIDGFTWLGRYFYFVFKWLPTQRYPEFLTTIWYSFQQLGLPVWPIIVFGLTAIIGLIKVTRTDGFNQLTLNLCLATNLVFSPYALTYHYVLLIPAFLWLANKSLCLGILAYFITLTPFILLIINLKVTWINILYPIFILLALWWIIIRKKGSPKHALNYISF